MEGFSSREWERALPWLDDAGLALYLLQKLKDNGASGVLPGRILNRLEQNLADNRQRVSFMRRQFDFLNRKLDGAHVRYAVVKGFSMVPQFCPDATLRHQSDLDYFVDQESLPVAQHVLEGAGYSLKKSSANELVYLQPSAWITLPEDEQYGAHAPYAVELRRAFWDSDSHGVALREPKFSFDSLRTHQSQGLSFRTLPEEGAFLIQVIHAFNHILSGWVRMSCLYEIGYFLNQRATDKPFWDRIGDKISGNPLLREIAVIVTGMSTQFFEVPVPPAIGMWGNEVLPAARIWMEYYARPWLFAKYRPEQFSAFAGIKFYLFLHQQYLSDRKARIHLLRLRLLPWEQFSRRTHSLAFKASTNPRGSGQQIKGLVARFFVHTTSGLRYLWEVPRWHRLIRAAKYLRRGRQDEPVGDLVNAQPPSTRRF